MIWATSGDANSTLLLVPYWSRDVMNVSNSDFVIAPDGSLTFVEMYSNSPPMYCVGSVSEPPVPFESKSRAPQNRDSSIARLCSIAFLARSFIGSSPPYSFDAASV